jgi:hypothetical protein
MLPGRVTFQFNRRCGGQGLIPGILERTTAGVAELADAQDLGSCGRKAVGVQIPPSAPTYLLAFSPVCLFAGGLATTNPIPVVGSGIEVRSMNLHRFLACTVRDVEILHNFHILLDEALETPASGHLDRPSAGLQGDDQEDSQTRLVQ